MALALVLPRNLRNEFHNISIPVFLLLSVLDLFQVVCLQGLGI